MAAREVALLALLLAGCAAPRALWIGGDVHLGNGGSERLAAIRDAVAPSKGVVNLEGPIGTEVEADASSEQKLINGPRALAALAEAGVAAVGTANNHSGDGGGTATPFSRSELMLEGLRVVVTAHDLRGGVPEGLSAQLKAARGTADVLVATFHVTGPPSFIPKPELEDAVEVALGAGATIVAAHGTHAVARVERRGEAVIAWGLGNLVFACRCTEETDGLVLRVELDAKGGVTRAEAVPVDAGLHGRNSALAHDPTLALQLLESLGSSPGERRGDRYRF